MLHNMYAAAIDVRFLQYHVNFSLTKNNYYEGSWRASPFELMEKFQILIITKNYILISN